MKTNILVIFAVILMLVATSNSGAAWVSDSIDTGSVAVGPGIANGETLRVGFMYKDQCNTATVMIAAPFPDYEKDLLEPLSGVSLSFKFGSGKTFYTDSPYVYTNNTGGNPVISVFSTVNIDDDIINHMLEEKLVTIMYVLREDKSIVLDKAKSIFSLAGSKQAIVDAFIKCMKGQDTTSSSNLNLKDGTLL